MAPRPPIFVADIEDVDLAVFRSVEEAEGFIEPPDVISGATVAFDSFGRRLRTTVQGRRTYIAVVEDAEQHDSELIQRIKAFSKTAELGIDPEDTLENWGDFIESAAKAIEAWMRR